MMLFLASLEVMDGQTPILSMSAVRSFIPIRGGELWGCPVYLTPLIPTQSVLMLPSGAMPSLIQAALVAGLLAGQKG